MKKSVKRVLFALVVAFALAAVANPAFTQAAPAGGAPAKVEKSAKKRPAKNGSKCDKPPGVQEVKANICMRGKVVECDCWSSGGRTLCNNCKLVEGPCKGPGPPN